MLYDRIMTLKGPTWTEIKSVMRETQVFDVSNVAEYFFNGTNQEHWDYYDDFPNVAPSYPMMWFEYRMPEYVLNETGRHKARNMFKHIGAVSIGYPAEAWKYVSAALSPRVNTQLVDIPPDTKWLAVWDLVGQTEKCRLWKADIYMPIMRCYVPIREDGTVAGKTEGFKGMILHPDLLTFLSGEKDVAAIPQQVLEDLTSLMYDLYPIFLAQSFLHTKNTVVDKLDPPVHVSNKHKQKTGNSLVSYHVLNIMPMREVLRSQGHADKTGLRKALHLCRGHFKNFKDRGLFGKYKGLFWWEAHIRGSKEHGLALKNYKVGGPNDQL